MSALYQEIEDMIQAGHSPFVVASVLEVPMSWVYEVMENMYSGQPDLADPTDEELEAMAEHYGYGQDVGCEFD